MESKNCWVVTTFTDTVAGEIVTLMFVTGSVHVEMDVVVEEVDVEVVQTTAVLGAADPPHEAMPKTAQTKIKGRRRFIAPLRLFFEISSLRRSVVSTRSPECEIKSCCSWKAHPLPSQGKSLQD
jgi:hypothetical protein